MNAKEGEDEIFHDIDDEEFYDVHDFPDNDGEHEDYPKAFQAYPTEVFEDEEAENYFFCDHDHLRRDRRPVFWEIYAGQGGLADAMERLGYEVKRFDLPEWNFELLSDRKRLWKLYVEEAPDIVWIAPPCTLWTPLQTWNKDVGALEVLWTRRSYDHRTNLSLARRIFKGQVKRKKIAVVEHPWTSSAWKTPAFRGLGGYTVDLDQCAFGSTLPNDEGVETPIQKRTCLKTTSEELLSMLGRKCPGDHSHQHVIGKTPGGVPRARAAGAYQPGFCSAVAVALDQVFLEGSFTTTEVRELVDHALLDANNACDEAEEFARLALARNDFSYEVLEKIANRIDLRKHQSTRHKKDGKLDTDEFAFIGGLWQFGGKHGITKGTSMYPTVCQYFNAFFRSKGYSGWSSFYLGKNIKTKVHVDCHNMRDTDSVTVSFGQFSGGRLWLADKDGNIPANDVVLKVDRTGKTLPGKYINTKEEPTVFDARKPHCTEDWSGTRWCLTMYTGRSLQNASNSLKQSLKSFGFPVAQDKPEQDHNQTARTPQRSARRTLWRNAKRVSALATWSILAASSMSTTGCDNGTKMTALFEWGGMHKTMEAAAGNYHFVEPLQKEDLLEDYGVDLARQAVRDLRPSTIWIHGGVLRDCVGRLRDVISEQLGSGRRIAIEAQLGDEFWTSQHVEGLGNGCSTRWTRFGDSQVMWLRNTAEDPGGDGQLHSMDLPEEERTTIRVTYIQTDCVNGVPNTDPLKEERASCLATVRSVQEMQFRSRLSLLSSVRGQSKWPTTSPGKIEMVKNDEEPRASRSKMASSQRLPRH